MAKEKDGEVLPLVVPVKYTLTVLLFIYFDKSAMLQQTIDELIELRDKGEVWYPLF